MRYIYSIHYTIPPGRHARCISKRDKPIEGDYDLDKIEDQIKEEYNNPNPIISNFILLRTEGDDPK